MIDSLKGMERKIKLKSLNPHITCEICKGYLINATTVTECLHTFCKSCLVKHLEEHKTCPKCDIVIHQSHPLNYISFDRTMQDIVYKLCPNLQQNEMKREREFYKKRGLPYPKMPNPSDQEKSEGHLNESPYHTSTKYSYSLDTNHNNNNNNNNTSGTIKTNGLSENQKSSSMDEKTGQTITCLDHLQQHQPPQDYHRSDEQVNILIENHTGSNLKSLKKKFIRCSAHTTVTHIKKFVSQKLHNTFDKYKDIDILCDDHILGKDHTLKFVFVTHWRFKDPPLKLTYRPKQDPF